MKLAAVKEADPEIAELVDWVGAMLVGPGFMYGAEVTDVGWDVRARRGEVIVQAPSARFEITARKL